MNVNSVRFVYVYFEDYSFLQTLHFMFSFNSHFICIRIYRYEGMFSGIRVTLIHHEVLLLQ